MSSVQAPFLSRSQKRRQLQLICRAWYYACACNRRLMLIVGDVYLHSLCWQIFCCATLVLRIDMILDCQSNVVSTPALVSIPISNCSVLTSIENIEKSCFFKTVIVRAVQKMILSIMAISFLIIQEILSTHSLRYSLEVILSSSMQPSFSLKLKKNASSRRRH